jgi:hypothetical protein
VKKVSTTQIGDGKLPNKYWVSVHNNFFYESKPGFWDWADERDGFKVEGNVVGVFSTYAKARELFDSIPAGEVFDGVLVRGKTIEDRMSGEVAEETGYEVNRLEYMETVDLEFTKKEMAAKKVAFK